jgi:cobalt-zinc-cadmium efflux system membrane fusion protein
VKTFPLAIPVLILLTGCGEKRPPVEAAAPSTVAAKPGQIVLPADSPRLAQLKVEPVTLADVAANEVVAPGKIEVNPNRISHVVLPVAGRVVAVLTKLGDSVQQGAPLLRIESPDIDTAVSTYLQGRATVEQAKSALLKANADYDRVKDLYEHNAIAKKEVLNAESAAVQAKAVVDQAQASVQQALRRLEILGLKPENFGQQLTVHAPISGKVLELTVAPGEFRNDLSASLITIADLSTVWVASDVAESDIRLIHIGERIDIELSAFPGETFHGRVTRLSDTLDPTTRTIKVRAEMDNAQGRLRPEMFGRIRHVGGSQQLPVVPAAAIVQSEGSSIVYREISKGVFEPVTIVPGDRAGDRVAVRSGVKVGDRIVTDGVMLLKGY